jgi:hypothetical protein
MEFGEDVGIRDERRRSSSGINECIPGFVELAPLPHEIEISEANSQLMVSTLSTFASVTWVPHSPTPLAHPLAPASVLPATLQLVQNSLAQSSTPDTANVCNRRLLS